MNIFFENQHLFFACGVCTLILISLIYVLKLTPKKAYFLKVIALSLLCFTLAKPYVLKTSEHSSRAFLIDISNSMPSENIYNRIKKLYDFGNEIYLFSEKITPYSISLGNLKNTHDLKETWATLNLNKTLIKDNIQKLLSEKNYSDIILYTDGFESIDSLESLDNLEKFVEKNIFSAKIFPLLPDFSNQKSNAKNNISLNINYSPKGTIHQKSEFKLFIANNGIKNRNFKIKVFQNDIEFLNENVFIKRDDILAKDILTNNLSKTLNKIDVKVLDDANNLIEKKEFYITATKKEEILLLSASMLDANFMQEIIKNLGFSLTSIYSGASNEIFDNLDKYSLIILNNFPYKSLGGNNDKKISDFVLNGGKLLMIGGENSFGLGGYSGTKIEDILPVAFNEPKKEILRANLGVVIILDNSQSMEDGKKIEYLKIASENLIKNLNNEDYLGIIGFNTNSFTIFPINKMKDTRKLAIESLKNIKTFGGTNLMPAIDDAINMLSKIKTGKKHIIILTDGQVPGHVKKFRDVATVVRMVGSTLSTILLGNTTYDKLLKEMAKVGNGNYYEANNEESLPNIFIKDLKFVKDSKDVLESIFKVEANKLINVSFSEYPDLQGLVNTDAKKDASVELYATNFIDKIPLLVSRNIGKGKTVAFTTDMNGRWSKHWILWDNIYIFWEQLINNILQDDFKKEHNILDYDCFYYIKNGILFFDINVFKNISFNELSFELTLPSGDIKKLDLEKLALGHFRAKHEALKAGEYKAALKYFGKKSSPIVLNVAYDETLEEKHFSANMSILNTLATKHRGKINPTKNDLEKNFKSSEKKDLSTLFLILSLISFLAGIYFRER
ncbi:MAG: VWA domain-containing protein [Bdellovibrionota bacterium]